MQERLLKPHLQEVRGKHIPCQEKALFQKHGMGGAVAQKLCLKFKHLAGQTRSFKFVFQNIKKAAVMGPIWVRPVVQEKALTL